MADSLAVIFPVFALILIGWLAGRARVLPDGAVDALNGFVVRLALPMLLFQFVAEADWDRLWQPGVLLAAAGAMGIAFVVGWCTAARHADVGQRSIEGLAASYCNGAFMGIPLAQGLLGVTGLTVAIMVSLLTILFFAIAIFVVEADRHSGAGWTRTAARVGRSVGSNPLVFAPAVGALWALTGWTIPAPVHGVTNLLGGAASPVALVTIGLFLADAPQAEGAWGGFARMSAVKLLLQPLIAWGLALWLGLSATWTAAVVLISALPTGSGPFIFAQLYDLDRATTARVILITTLLSAITLPLVSFFWL